LHRLAGNAKMDERPILTISHFAAPTQKNTVAGVNKLSKPDIRAA